MIQSLKLAHNYSILQMVSYISPHPKPTHVFSIWSSSPSSVWKGPYLYEYRRMSPLRHRGPHPPGNLWGYEQKLYLDWEGLAFPALRALK